MKFIEMLDDQQISHQESGHHHCSPGFIQLCCPFCDHGGNGYHMGYSQQFHFVNCWRCGPHGLIETVQALTGLPWHTCLEMGLERQPGALPGQVQAKGQLVIPPGVHDQPGARHKRYLLKRGFSIKELQKLWKIAFISQGVKLFWRIFIPIYYQGQMVSYTTRAVVDRGIPRYLACKAGDEAVSHRSLLYGEDYARHAICIVEGPVDAWRIGPGAVATFGTGFNKAQVLKMTNYPVRAVCFDSAPDAQRRAEELASWLEPFPGKTLNVVLKAKDPGAASTHEIEKLRERVFGSPILQVKPR